MNKVVINTKHGGFNLSKKALSFLHEKHGVSVNFALGRTVEQLERHDYRLVDAIETLGSDDASGMCSYLKVVEIEGWVYRIDEYDGWEYLETPEKIDWVVIKNDRS